MVLQQIPADLTTRPREVVERVEVEPRNDGYDDATFWVVSDIVRSSVGASLSLRQLHDRNVYMMLESDGHVPAR